MPQHRKTATCETVAEAAELLKNGHLVAFPTETVYGLGADARNPDSVARIFESKQRPSFDPLIVHVSDTNQAKKLVTEFSQTAELLAEQFWPGPLTLVLPRNSQVPDLVTSGLDGVGIRIPNHSMALQLLQLANCPVAAPSANPFGGISPTTAQHVRDGLDGRIDGILDGGPCKVGVESTVLSLMTPQPTLLRPGGTPIEEIESVVGPVLKAKSDPEKDDSAQPAPGMLSRHYAPSTPLTIITRGTKAIPIAGKQSGLLTYGPETGAEDGFACVESLSPDENLRTCAANLFAAMRSLDSANLDVIIAHNFPDFGLGLALNDRLHRAATL